MYVYNRKIVIIFFLILLSSLRMITERQAMAVHVRQEDRRESLIRSLIKCQNKVAIHPNRLPTLLEELISKSSGRKSKIVFISYRESV